MAGGSQITINNQGITITTHGKVIFKAGQHQFEGGEKLLTDLPYLPHSNLEGFNQGFHLISDEPIAHLPFKLSNAKHHYQFNASLNEQQQTQFVQTGTAAEKLELKYVGDEEINHQWKK